MENSLGVVDKPSNYHNRIYIALFSTTINQMDFQGKITENLKLQIRSSVYEGIHIFF